MTDQEIQEATDEIRRFMDSIRENVLESPTEGMPDPEALAAFIAAHRRVVWKGAAVGLSAGFLTSALERLDAFVRRATEG